MWAGCILILSVLPKEAMGSLDLFGIKGFDKVLHAGAYALLAFLMMYGGRKRLAGVRMNFDRFSWSVFLFAGLYGIVMEWLQRTYSSTRYFEVPDIIANIIGALCGVAVYIFFNKIMRRDE